MEEAVHDLPLKDEQKLSLVPDPAYQDPETGKLLGGSPPTPVFQRPEIHPLAFGLRKAKEQISAILADEGNLAVLQEKLQEAFDKDPTKFLLVFEPLLRRYEELGGAPTDQKVSVKILTQGPTQVNIQSDSDSDSAQLPSEEAQEDGQGQA